MELIFDGFYQAFLLIIKGNNEVVDISLLSLYICVIAIVLSIFFGLPLGTFLALNKNFSGRNFSISLVNSGMALPPVVVGLFVAMFLWRSGPLGFLTMLYTPTAMVIAQVIIATPVIAGLSMVAIQQLNPKLKYQILALGATKFQMFIILFKEARLQLLAAVMAGFGAIISEVGAVMMVGGNIKGDTRVLTTAIVMETRMGNFDMAIALSLILLGLIFMINAFLTFAQQKARK